MIIERKWWWFDIKSKELDKYEYTIKYFDIGVFAPNVEKHKDEILEEINKLGNLGWELVNCMPVNTGAFSQTDSIMAIFKRKIMDKE